MGVRIFLSYRRDDTAAYAGRLYDNLKGPFHDDVFRDIDGLSPGVNYVDVINERLDKCDVLLAIIGPGWLGATDTTGRRRLELSDDFVRLEIATALNRDIFVVPVLVGGAEMPPLQVLPHDLAPLTRRQDFRLSDAYWSTEVGKLVADLKKLPARKKRLRRLVDATSRPRPRPSVAHTSTKVPADSDASGSPQPVAPQPAGERFNQRTRAIFQNLQQGKRPTSRSADQWADLEAALQSCALSSSGVPRATGPASLSSVLDGIKEAQTSLLDAMERSTELLQEESFALGQSNLQDAGRVDPGDPEYLSRLHDSAAHFRSTYQGAMAGPDRALIEFNLGLVSFLSGARSDAREWLGTSYASASSFVEECASRSNDIKVFQNKKSAGAAALFVPEVVAVKFWKLWNAERARTALDECLPFVNCVATCFNVSGSGSGGDLLPRFVLAELATGGYELRPTSPGSYEGAWWCPPASGRSDLPEGG